MSWCLSHYSPKKGSNSMSCWFWLLVPLTTVMCHGIQKLTAITCNLKVCTLISCPDGKPGSAHLWWQDRLWLSLTLRPPTPPGSHLSGQSASDFVRFDSRKSEVKEGEGGWMRHFWVSVKQDGERASCERGENHGGESGNKEGEDLQRTFCSFPRLSGDRAGGGGHCGHREEGGGGQQQGGAGQ